MTKTTDTPYSNESEMMVLGCMLTGENALKLGLKRLDESDFYREENRAIFHCLKTTSEAKKPCDIHIISEELKRIHKLDQVGGVGYLTLLAQYAGTSAYMEEYTTLVKEKAILRRMLHLAKNMERVAQTEPSDVQSMLDLFHKEFEGLKRNELRSDSLYGPLLNPVSEKEIAQEIQNTSAGAYVGLKIGEVDLKLPGGAITIVAGPTGHGKTLVLINLILNYLSLNPDKRVFFFSFEESRAAILSLFLNTYVDEELSKNSRESIKSYFRDGQPTYISPEKRAIFSRKKSEFFSTLIETGRLNIFYCDYSSEELTEAIRFLKKKTDVGLVGIDYMQLLTSNTKKSTQRQEELKQICLAIKDCAVETGIPFLLAAQFNRTVVNEATLSPVAIGEAGDIERAANMILGLWNRNYEGFTEEGNLLKNNRRKAPKESAVYLEILKGREVGIGHSAILDLNGNTGKLTARNAYHKPLPSQQEPISKQESDDIYDLGRFK
jgi:replicative DNA helicase